MKSETVSDRKSPGFWFYTADYERDMQILSLASQGLWSRMLCWAHDNEAHRGFLELATGAPMTHWDIAAKVGKTVREIEKCLEEMERVGTYSRDDRGCIFCRRMARESHISGARKAAANSRWDKSKKAADPDFASGFAYAKGDAKNMQNGSVTASVSDSDSVLLTQTPVRAPVAQMPSLSPPSQRFPEWWALWSATKGTNHRMQAESAYFRRVTLANEYAVLACTKSYLESLDNPGKGYNPENFLDEQARDEFRATWPARASPATKGKSKFIVPPVPVPTPEAEADALRWLAEHDASEADRAHAREKLSQLESRHAT